MLSKQQLFTNKKGFTLVELMVGMVVALIVMGMSYAIFTSQLRLTNTEMRINDLQLNSQVALRYLTKKIRNLGFGVTTKIPFPNIVWYDGDENAQSGGGNDIFIPWPSDKLPYTDAIAYFKPIKPSEMTVQSFTQSGSQLTLKGENILDNSGDDVGYFLLLIDTTNNQYAVVKITGYSVDTTNSLTSVSFVSGNVPSTFTPSSAIIGDLPIFYVDNNNVLREKKAKENLPLMKDVLSFQVQAGIDTDADDMVDSWTYNASGVSGSNEIKGIKFYIFTATSHQEKGIKMSVQDKINELDADSNGVWSNEVNWDAVLQSYQQRHGTFPGIPRVYTFGCTLRNVFTCN